MIDAYGYSFGGNGVSLFVATRFHSADRLFVLVKIDALFRGRGKYGGSGYAWAVLGSDGRRAWIAAEEEDLRDRDDLKWRLVRTRDSVELDAGGKRRRLDRARERFR